MEGQHEWYEYVGFVLILIIGYWIHYKFTNWRKGGYK